MHTVTPSSQNTSPELTYVRFVQSFFGYRVLITEKQSTASTMSSEQGFEVYEID